MSAHEVGPGPGDRVGGIEALRAFAALAVVVDHCFWARDPGPTLGWLNPIIAASELGADMFFVISGFVLFRPFVRGTFDGVRGYFIRRGARIMPAYVASLVAVIVFWQHLWPPGTLPHPFHAPDALIRIVSHLTLTQSIVYAFVPGAGFMGLGANPVVWTLTLEACFYVTLPLVAARFARHPLVWLLTCGVVAVCWRLIVFNNTSLEPLWLRGALHYLGDGFPGFLAHFAVGMFACYASCRWRAPRQVAALVAAAGLFVLIASALAFGSDSVAFGIVARTNFAAYQVVRIGFAVGFGCLLWSIVSAVNPVQDVLASRPLRWLGDRSYGIFLFHVPIVLALKSHTRLFSGYSLGSFVFVLAVTIPLAIAAGALSFTLFERPAIRWARARTAVPVRDLDESRQF